MEDTLFRGNREATLDQVLAEPIVRLLMQRDGWDEGTIRRLMRKAAPVPPRLRLVASTPRRDAPLPQASIGVLAQRAATPPWPRVFPSL